MFSSVASGARPPQAKAEAAVSPVRVQLTGMNHRWQMAYVDEQGRPTLPSWLESGHDLHVPINADIVLTLKSTDYIYTLAIPEFGLKEIAVPKLEFRMAFEPTQVGRYQLVGDELCGGLNGIAAGRMVVESSEQFRKRLEKIQRSALNAP